ncbi:regulatory-associated protein of TOR 1-like [Gossypium arboreum]|nr:regulatory-associated protein of TOR 1-like [Gossypium arboreum]
MVVCLPSLTLSAAGMVVNAFIELLDCGTSNYPGSSRDYILLAACEAHETLPQSAEFPAYVFTSCLTTPIKMTLRWCILWLSVPVFWILWRLN